MKNNLDKFFRDKLGDREVPFDPAMWEKVKPAINHEIRSTGVKNWPSWSSSKGFILLAFIFLLIGIVGINIYTANQKENYNRDSSTYSDLKGQNPGSASEMKEQISEGKRQDLREKTSTYSQNEMAGLEDQTAIDEERNAEKNLETPHSNITTKQESEISNTFQDRTLEEEPASSPEVKNEKNGTNEWERNVNNEFSKAFDSSKKDKKSTASDSDQMNDQREITRSEDNIGSDPIMKEEERLISPVADNSYEDRMRITLYQLRNQPLFIDIAKHRFSPLSSLLTTPPIIEKTAGGTTFSIETFYLTNKGIGGGLRMTKDFAAGTEIYGGIGFRYLSGRQEAIGRDSIVTYSFGVTRSFRQFNDEGRYQLTFPVGMNYTIGSFLLTGGVEVNYLLGNRAKMINLEEAVTTNAPSVWVDLPPQNTIGYEVNMGVGYQLSRRLRLFSSLQYRINSRFTDDFSALGTSVLPGEPSYFINLKMTYDLFK